MHEHDETHLPSLARSFPSLVVLFFYSHSSLHSHLPPTRYTPPTTPTSPFPSEPDKQSDTLEINTTPPHHYRPCLWCLAQLCRVHERASLHPAVHGYRRQHAPSPGRQPPRRFLHACDTSSLHPAARCTRERATASKIMLLEGPFWEFREPASSIMSASALLYFTGPCSSARAVRNRPWSQ